MDERRQSQIRNNNDMKTKNMVMILSQCNNVFITHEQLQNKLVNKKSLKNVTIH